MRSFFAADDALPRADAALAERIIDADVEANERRLMTERELHSVHLRRHGLSILCDLPCRHG
jgi:hypothetical protein